MYLKDVVILAAQTARSNAYLQAIHNQGLSLGGAVLFGDGQGTKPGQTNDVPQPSSGTSQVFLPDLSIPVEKILSRVCNNIKEVNASHVNDQIIAQELSSFAPKLVIYSGYGSQIVGEHLLRPDAPFLHIHSGWLPDFRGSTTTYYHLLVTGTCGVSAILLEKDIDTGPIVARKEYPKPPAGMDIDYIYDTAIRADLLVEVLKHFGKHGRLPELTNQSKEDGNTYYIIHPVLKHKAILSLKKEKTECQQ